MPPASTSWILFTCCILNSWIWVSLGQEVKYPKPSIEVIPSNVIIKGGNFTICCKAPSAVVKFILHRNNEAMPTLDPAGNQAEFHFVNVQPQDSGAYVCRYNPTSQGDLYSDASDTINMQVKDFFPKPSLKVSSGKVVVRGGTLTFRCSGEQLNMRFTLRYGGAVVVQTEEPIGYEAVFTIADVQQKDEGSYDCLYQTKSSPTIYSDASYYIYIRVRDDDDKKNKSEPTKDSSGNEETKIPNTTEKSSNDGEAKTPDARQKPSTGDPTPIIISVVCAALLLISLLVIAVLYRRRRQKKTKADIQAKGLRSSEEKPSSAPEIMYATVPKRKSPDATNVPAVQVPDQSEDQEGLTYVTINQDAHKKKRPSQPRSDQDNTVYAAVNLR